MEEAFDVAQKKKNDEQYSARNNDNEEDKYGTDTGGIQEELIQAQPVMEEARGTPLSEEKINTLIQRMADRQNRKRGIVSQKADEKKL